MKNLEFRFAFLLVLTVVFACAVFSVNADVASDSDLPWNSDKNSIDDDPGDHPRFTDDHTPGVNYVEDDDEDDDDIGDEGFYDGDDDDEDVGDSLGQSLVKGSASSSVVHKKDEIRHLNGQNTSTQQHHLADYASSDESGLFDDSESSGSGSGSGSAEVRGQGLYARQYASEEENNGDEDASADKDEIDDSADEDEEQEKKTHNNEHNAIRLRSNALHKHPRNLIKKILKESKDAEQEEKSASQERDSDEESSGQDSGSSSSFVPESGEIRVPLEEEHPISKPHPKNMTGIETRTSAKEEAKENVTKNDREHKGSDNQNKTAGTGKSKDEVTRNKLKSTQHKNASSHGVQNDKTKRKMKTTVKTEKISVQNTQPHKKPAKKEPIRTLKVSPHLARKKLHNKFLAANVTHPHVVKSHTKVTHIKPVSKAAPPTCHADRILAAHSLKGGTRAGRFEVLGDTASMHACLQRCCTKQACDAALLIDGRCYGVACYREDLCEAIPVPHPHFIFSQLGFVNKGQKRGDIRRNQEFHCQYGNLTLRNNEQWSGELCGGVVRCKDGIATVTKCPGIPPKPDDCAKPRLHVKHHSGKCCQMKWKCKARHCIFNNRLIKHGYKLSDPLCTGVVSCYNGHLNMEYCPKIPDKPTDCARPKLKTINIPGKCCKKLWVCTDKSCKYDGLKLSHGEKLTDASCAVVMECKNGFLRNKQCPGPPPVPHSCINPTLKVKRLPGECCEMSWTCEMS